MNYIYNKIHIITLGILISLFSYLYNPSFKYIYGGDLGSYKTVAENVLTVSNGSASPIYPIIILIGEKLPLINWDDFCIFINWVLHILLGYYLWQLFRLFKFRKLVRWVLILIILLSPRLMYYKYDLSPEFLFSFLIFFLFYYITKNLIVKTNSQNLRTLIIIGFISSLCSLTKPIWMFGGIFISFFLLYHIKIKEKHAWKAFFILLITNIIIILPWQLYLHSNSNFSNIHTRNLNLMAIRAGFYSDAERTELYNLIDNNENLSLLEKDIQWDNFNQFTQIKNTITIVGDSILRNDNKFYEKALYNNIMPYLVIQLKRIPSFINSKFINLLNWHIWPRVIELNYLRLYKLIYLICVPILFIAGLFHTFLRLNSLGLLATIFILYYTFVCVFVSYQNPAFIRFRVGIDPILISYFFICFRNIKFLKYRRT